MPRNDNAPGLSYRTFAEFFDPYDPKHVEAAATYLGQNAYGMCEFPEGFIPEDVILNNHYGIQMHILYSMARAWILFKTLGIKDAPPA